MASINFNSAAGNALAYNLNGGGGAATAICKVARLYTAPPTDDEDLTTGTEANFGGYSGSTSVTALVTPTYGADTVEWTLGQANFQCTSAPTNLINAACVNGESIDRVNADPDVVLMEWQEAKAMNVLDVYRVAIKVKVRCV